MLYEVITGFYSIDITYNFNVVIEAFSSTSTPGQTVSGTSRFCKKVILYGSDGNAKIFNSNTPVAVATTNANNNLRITSYNVCYTKLLRINCILFKLSQ